MKRHPLLGTAGIIVGLLSLGLLTSCGTGVFEAEPSFEEQCGGGTILEDSATSTAWAGEDFVSVTMTIRLCVDRGGSVIAVELR